MLQNSYLMEHKEESIRLDIKTDGQKIQDQALWAGAKSGMRIADLGCGSGKTTYYLNKIAKPDGEVIGIDFSQERIRYAKNKYFNSNIKYYCRDFREPLSDLGFFDFIWVRFVLEHYKKSSFDLVKNMCEILNPGGILCLLDLDHNCLSHFGFSERLEKAIFQSIYMLESQKDFDPYVGRKLYSFLYDLNFDNIDVNFSPHHLIFGELKEKDAYNWLKKLEIAAKNSGYSFSDYKGGFDEFAEDFTEQLHNPRRFIYTPIICCRGQKPLA